MPRAVQTITLPGAIDLHIHLREPSNNKAETIKSGSQAALLGGYSLVCDMPNNPGNPTWTLERVEEKQRLIRRNSHMPIAVYGGAQPESDNLNELGEMSKRSIGLKLYGSPNVTNYQDYKISEFKPIILKWHQVAPKQPIMFHLGNSNLEEIISLVASEIGHPLHICHVSKPEEVASVVKAKRKGLRVTCGACPHHLFKTSYETNTEGWFARMLPPLARQSDTERLWEMFVDGDIDVLETDHAPHPAVNKWKAEEENPDGTPGPGHTTCFGVPGVEFALPLLFYQMSRGRISIDRIVEATSKKPAEIIGVKLLTDTKVTWLMKQYRIGEEHPKGLSGSGWTPYANNLAVGVVQRSVIGGKVVVENGQLKTRLPRVVKSDSVI